MFTFTKRTDYALLALSYLAAEAEGRVIGPREIAQHFEIPAELLAKIMQTLSKQRIVTSVPGPTGGYRLSRADTAISIAEIVEAIDGPLAIAQCWESGGTDGCRQAERCHLRGPLAKIQEELVRLLQSMTLADVRPPEMAMPPRDFAPGRALAMAGMATGTDLGTS